MGFLDKLGELERSNIYSAWRKDNPDCYLVYGFFMEDKAVEPEWQIGYYDPKTDKVQTFTLAESIGLNPETEALKKEGSIAPLDTKKVNFDFAAILETANSVQRQEYPQHTPVKKIFIIQNLEDKNLWNITFVSATFNTLNIKIDADTGEVVSKQLLSLFRVEK